jgi:hypothetical protein
MLRESMYRVWFDVSYYLLPLVEYLPSRDGLDVDENGFYVRSGSDESNPSGMLSTKIYEPFDSVTAWALAGRYGWTVSLSGFH